MSENTQAPSAHGRRYWRSLDDHLENPEFKSFVRKEFPGGSEQLDGVNRRHFVKIMAASFALAGVGMSGCRRPEYEILPYAKQPERIIPGIPVYYTSCFANPKGAIPLVVETQQARPTKIEGNENYAPTGGSTDLFAQASILDLYDPDRMTRSASGSEVRSQAQVREILSKISSTYAGKGAGLAILAEPSTSPTRARLRAELEAACPGLIWAEHDSASSNNPESAAEKTFAPASGTVVRANYNFKTARRILSLDSDFLQGEADSLRYARDYASARRVLHSADANPEKLNRLYVAEASLSTTGGMADHRLRIASSGIPAFAALVLAEVLKQSNLEPELAAKLRAQAANLPSPTKFEGHAENYKRIEAFKLEQWVSLAVADLLAAKGESVVVVGENQSEAVHVIGQIINDLLGAVGKTVSYLSIPAAKSLSAKDLVSQAGSIKTLVILGSNPAYDAPADLGWSAFQTKIRDAGKLSDGTGVVRLAYHFDETAELSNLAIAATHYLESWGDARTATGDYLVRQPMIQPLFEGLGELEVLALLTGKSADKISERSLVQQSFQTLTGDSTDKAWRRWLNEGFHLLPYSATTTFSRAKALAQLRSAELAAPVLSKEKLEVVILPSPAVRDGRYANNGWLQEVPDSLTKLTWDNVILISPRLAEEIGIVLEPKKLARVSAVESATFNLGREFAPVYSLTVNGAKVTGAIHIQPGLADYSVVIHQGYGRTQVGRVGQGAGFSAFPLVSSSSPSVRTGATLAATGETKRLANTQQHWSMEGRAIVREANVEDYVKQPGFVAKMDVEAHAPAIYGDRQPQQAPKTAEEIKTKAILIGKNAQETPRGNSSYEHPDFADLNADGKISDVERATNHQWGMTIDLSTCTSCNACVVACQSENNIPVVGREQVMSGREMHWIRIDRYFASGSGDFNKYRLPEDPQVVLQPVACMHCETAPCEQVCPFTATVHDNEGLNTMAYNRCAGTRYCSNNCPYKVRRFNFFDYNKRELGDNLYAGVMGKKGRLYDKDGLLQLQKNPDVTVRMRGVMEKCTYCVQRIEEAKINQRAKVGLSANVKVPDGTFKVACQQVCPTGAIVFGDITDPNAEVTRWKTSDRDYGVLAYTGTRPRTSYLARLRNPHAEVAKLDGTGLPLTAKEDDHSPFATHGHAGDDHGHPAKSAEAPKHN